MSQPTTQDIDTLVQQARRQTQHFLRLGAEHFQIPTPPAKIDFDLRGQSAGQVRCPLQGLPRVRYNLQLLVENGEKFLQRTVPHESAHIIAYQVFGTRIRPHGEQWQRIMALFGADPSRCHDFDTRRALTRRLAQFAYHCACQEHALSSIRHRRAQRGQIYCCRACGQALRPGRPVAGI
jgi:SprT protein